MQSLHLWTSVYLSNNSSFAGPEDTTVQTVTATEGSTESPAGLQKTRSCENILMLSDLNTSLSRRKSDPNITMDHCEQQAQKLLKDAIGGDTSCSSESVKSSENDRSLSENGDVTLNGLDSPHPKEDGGSTKKENVEGEIRENGISDGDRCSHNGVMNGENCDMDSNGVDTEHNEVNGSLENGQLENTSSVQSKDRKSVSKSESEAEVDKERETTGVGLKGAVDVAERTDDLENGIAHDLPLSNGDFTNGNGSHEMNGHTNSNPDTRGSSPDSTIESSENSIETISEGEETENGVNGAKREENGGWKTRKDSRSKFSNGLSNGDSKDIDSKIVAMKMKQRNANPSKYAPSMESSSDTVIEELPNGNSSHTLIPSISRNINEVASLQSLCDKVTTRTLNSIENTISISTSTSDLTDSRIHEKFLANGLPGENLLNVGDSLHASLKLRCILSQTGLCKGANGTYRGVNIDTSVGSSLQPTPISPQSRNSTCPPTPGTSDGRVRHTTDFNLSLFIKEIENNC